MRNANLVHLVSQVPIGREKINSYDVLKKDVFNNICYLLAMYNKPKAQFPTKK